jgi:hypothetical protein
MPANTDPPDSVPPLRAAAVFDRPVALVAIGGFILFLIAWFVQERYWVLEQRTLARVAILNGRVAAAHATEDELVTRVGEYLTAERRIVDAFEDQLEERELRDELAAADKLLDGWGANEESLKLRILTRFHREDIQTAFSSMLTLLDTLADDVDELRDPGADSSSDPDDVIDRCREDIEDVENALGSLSLAMASYVDRLPAQPDPSSTR